MPVRLRRFGWLAPIAVGASLSACQADSTSHASEQTGPLLYGIAAVDDGYTLARVDTGTGEVEPVHAIEDPIFGLVTGPERRLYALEIGSDAHLVTFDATTGSRSYDVEVPLSQLAGFEAATNKVIAITSPESPPAKIIRIDPRTGDVEEGAIVDGFASRSLETPLAFDGARRIVGVDQKLAPDGVSFSSADIVVIDVATGSVQRIETGRTALEYPVFDARSGLLYAVSPGDVAAIVSVDLTSGDVEEATELPMDHVTGATFDAGFGRLLVFGYMHRPAGEDGGRSIVSADLDTGEILWAPAVASDLAFEYPAFVDSSSP